LHLDSLDVHVVELVLGDEFDDFALIGGHGLEHEADADFLVVVLHREERGHVFQFLGVRGKRVHLDADHVALVERMVAPQNTRTLNMVY